MATYNTPLITTQGLALLKAEIAGSDSVTFTKIVFSSDDYSQSADSLVQALTGLSSLDLTAPARSFTDVNGNLKIRGMATNQNTTSAFYIKTYGLYGKNDAGNEMLIAVATAQNANFVPAYNGKQTNQVAYTFNIAINSTDNITLSSATDIPVTQADIATINNAVSTNTGNISSVQSQVTSNYNQMSSMNSDLQVASNNALQALNELNQLSGQALKIMGEIPSKTISDITTPGIYNLNANVFTDSPYGSVAIYGQLIVVTMDGITPQMLISNGGDIYTRVMNSWGITNWQRLATSSDVNQINANINGVQNQVYDVDNHSFKRYDGWISGYVNSLDDLLKLPSGFSQIGNAPFLPDGSSKWGMINKYTLNDVFVTYFDQYNGSIWTIAKVGGTWSPWRKIGGG